jgi:hypothetical protein
VLVNVTDGPGLEYKKMECAVCYSDVKAPVKLVCGHAFCQECVKSWYLKGTGAGCPMCRRPVYFKGFHKIRQDWEFDSWYNQCQEVFGETLDAYLEASLDFAKLFGIKRIKPRSVIDLESTFHCTLMEGLFPDDVDYVLNESGIYRSSRLFNRVSKYYRDPIKTKVMRRDNKQRRKWIL